MQTEKKVRDLIKPQRVDQNQFAGESKVQNQSLVVPYCGSGYTTWSDGTVSCASGYSSNLWCTSKPTEGDDLLF
ncbi:MAG TPA: hypothetical protein VK518_04090 [Puia sp.]|nr:hypothetical protein [Puia sp.]